MRTNSQHSMFKKVLACVLSFAMVASMVTFVTFGASAETVSYWDGVSFTDRETLVSQSGAINSAADLAGLLKANKATDGWAGCSFVLNCDINLGGYDWAGISSDDAYPFVASFDFNGHSITGLSSAVLASDAVEAAKVTVDIILAAFNGWIGEGKLASRDYDDYDTTDPLYGTYYDDTPADAIKGFPFFAGLGTPFKAMYSAGYEDNDAMVKVDGNLQIGGADLQGKSFVEIFKMFLSASSLTTAVTAEQITGEYLAGKFGDWLDYIKTGVSAGYFTNGRYVTPNSGAWDILAEYPEAWEAQTVADLEAVATAATPAEALTEAGLFGYHSGTITGASISTVAPRTTSTWDGVSATDLATLLGQSTGTVMPIRSAADLAGVKATVAAGLSDFTGWVLNLECDIDLDGYEWSGIGTAAMSFKGTFNFNGYSVAGLSELALSNAAVAALNATAGQLLNAFNAWIGNGVLASRDSDNWDNPGASDFGTYYDNTPADAAMGFPFFAGIGTPFKAMYNAGYEDNTAIVEVDGDLQIGGSALKGKSLVELFKMFLASAVPGTVTVAESAITGEYLAGKFGDYITYIKSNPNFTDGRYAAIKAGTCDVLANFPAAWEAHTSAELAAAATSTDAQKKEAALFGFNGGVINDAVIETRVARGSTSVWDGVSYTDYTTLMSKGGQINSAADLAGLYYGVKDNNAIVDGWAGYTFKLNCNIDLANKAWNAIGSAVKNFKGNFDFNGNSIINLNASAMNTAAVKATKTTAEALVAAYNILMNSGVATSRDYDGTPEAGQPFGTYYDNNWWDYRWGFPAYTGMCNVFQLINGGWDLAISYNGDALVFGSDAEHQLTGKSIVDLVNEQLASVNSAVCRDGVTPLTQIDAETFAACVQTWIDYCKSPAYNDFGHGSGFGAFEAAHNGQLDILANYPGIWSATTVADIAAAAEAPVDTTAPAKAAVFGYTTGSITDADISLYVEEGPTAKSIFLDKFVGKTLTVTSKEDLDNIVLYIGDFDTLGWEGYTFVLGNDVDLENTRWSGLGTADQAFAGIFDFNGHKITGLNAEDLADYAVTADDLIAAFNILMASGVATSRQYDGSPEDQQPFGTYYDNAWWDYRWGFPAYSGLCNVLQVANSGYDFLLDIDGNEIIFGSVAGHQFERTSMLAIINANLASVNTSVCRNGVTPLTEVDLDTFVACLQSWIDYCKSSDYNNFAQNGQGMDAYRAAHDGDLDILVNYPGIWTATNYADIALAATEIADRNVITVPAFLGNFTGSAVGGAVDVYSAEVEADGDVNGDGDVTSADATFLLYHTFYAEDYVLDCSGDVNGDGDVTSADATYLLYYTFYPEDYTLYPQV